MARYLKKLLGGVYVEATEVAVYWDACGRPETVFTPPAVGEFMRQFDAGKWDHLVDERAEIAQAAEDAPATLADALLGVDDGPSEDDEAVLFGAALLGTT